MIWWVKAIVQSALLISWTIRWKLGTMDWWSHSKFEIFPRVLHWKIWRGLLRNLLSYHPEHPSTTFYFRLHLKLLKTSLCNLSPFLFLWLSFYQSLLFIFNMREWREYTSISLHNYLKRKINSKKTK